LTPRQSGVVLFAGFAFSLGIALQSQWVNGFGTGVDGTGWPWRDLDIPTVAALLLAPFVIIVAVLWKIWCTDSPATMAWLWLLAAANYLLQIMSMQAEVPGLPLVRDLVESPMATSYFTDALAIHGLAPWLRHYHQIPLGFHSLTHPPGPILFFHAFLKLFDPHTASLLGGCAIGLLGSLGVVVMYRFAALWTSNIRTRFVACAVYALTPSLTVFFPEFDQAYPLFTMLLMLFWVDSLAIPPRSRRSAMLFGAVLSLAVFFAYNLLSIGAFPAYFSLYWLWRKRGRRAAWLTLMRTCGIASFVSGWLYLALWRFTGYNPAAAFVRALRTQAVFASQLGRQYSTSVLMDPADFFRGAGMLAAPILAIWLLRRARGSAAGRRTTAMTLLALATILSVDVSGVLRGETARVWLFLQPLVAVPVAVVLAATRWQWRLAILAMQWWILVCLKSRLDFIMP
jgi:hypothetical protein